MRQLNLALMAGAFVLLLSLGQLLLLRVLNTVWWRKKWVRRLSVGLFLFTLLVAAGWGGATYFRATGLIYIFATATSLAAVLSFALILSLPLSGIINTAHSLWEKWRARRQEHVARSVSQNRRVVLQGLAAVFPVSALAMGTNGLTRSFATADVREIEFFFAGLPDELDGFKILHVSDSHLGPYVNNVDLEAILLKAESFRPDLLLFSGDIADDLTMLPDCISLLEQFPARFGRYASMGNHDYFRGAARVISEFDKSSVPMLIDNGIHLQVGEASLFVGGVDDPRRMGVPVDNFLRTSVEKTLMHAHKGSFKVLMSHRPSAFDAAAEKGVELTLAGHTHGTQVGFMGRPLFEEWGGERYVWGKYRIGTSQLYTSSGVGHWFPFRLGCPTEAPVIVLRKGDAPRTAPLS